MLYLKGSFCLFLFSTFYRRQLQFELVLIEFSILFFNKIVCYDFQFSISLYLDVPAVFQFIVNKIKHSSPITYQTVIYLYPSSFPRKNGRNSSILYFNMLNVTNFN